MFVTQLAQWHMILSGLAQALLLCMMLTHHDGEQARRKMAERRYAEALLPPPERPRCVPPTQRITGTMTPQGIDG